MPPTARESAGETKERKITSSIRDAVRNISRSDQNTSPRQSRDGELGLMDTKRLELESHDML